MKDGQGHEYYNKLIKFLEYYVTHHFDHEENLQKEVGYYDCSRHKTLHNEFRNHVEELISHNDEKNITNSDLIKVNLFIKNWLSHHILEEDKKLGIFISAKEE